MKGRRGPSQRLFARVGSSSGTRSAVPEVKLSHPLQQFVKFVNGADTGGQQALFQCLGRAAVLFAVGRDGSPQTVLDTCLRGPSRKGQRSGSRSAGVEMRVRLQQTPQISVVGDGVFQDGSCQQGILIGRHALHHDLFE